MSTTVNPDNARRGRLSKARGKAVEREVLDLLGYHLGETFHRNPDNGTKQCDVESDTYVVEVKSRQTEPYALIKVAEEQVNKARDVTGKRPLMVFTFIQDRKRAVYLLERIK